MSTGAAAAAAARQKAINSYVEQDWQRIQAPRDEANEWDEAEGGEEWECVACGRTFRSEKQWDSHERSKKHLKEVQR